METQNLEVALSAKFVRAAGISPVFTSTTPAETIKAVVAEIERRIELLTTEFEAGENKAVRRQRVIASQINVLTTLAGYLAAAKFEPPVRNAQLLEKYVSADDAELPPKEFLRMVRDRIHDDL
jgi:hypothetical protein